MISKEVKIYVEDGILVPAYKTEGAAALDLSVKKEIVLMPNEFMIAPTGIYVEIPEGYYLEITPRSSLGKTYSGIFIPNSPGIVDSDYRGEIGICLYNSTSVIVTIPAGERIAQGNLKEVIRIDWRKVSDSGCLSQTERGSGGFGSTGRG